jgi:hypothetical protein
MASTIKLNELHEKQAHLLVLSQFHGNFYAQKDYISVGRDFWPPCIWYTIKQNINITCTEIFIIIADTALLKIARLYSACFLRYRHDSQLTSQNLKAGYIA